MATGVKGKWLGSEVVTEGIRVRADPSFLPEHSDTDSNRYVFGYHIRITNQGEQWAKLLSRRWLIVDSLGQTEEVIGEGVVNTKPELAPGDTFEYSSYCPLSKPWGTMEGEFTMQRENGDLFTVRIGRFYLAYPRGE